MISVMVRGKYFPSVSLCAAHFGIRKNTVYHHLSQGTFDSIGLGTPRCGPTGTPFKYRDLSFVNMKSASEALGRHKGYVGQVLKRGDFVAKNRLYERLDRLREAAQ